MTTTAATAAHHTDDELVRAHLLELRRHNARPETIRHRQANLKRLRKAIGKPLAEIRADDLLRWQDALRDRLKIASVRCYTSHVRAFYAWAHEAGHLEHDPARVLVPPRVPQGRARPITEDRLRVAIRCAQEPVRTWLLLASYCGLRAGEIARLTAEGICEEVADIDGKGGKQRTVYLPPAVRTALLAHVQGPGVIFRRVNGQPRTPADVSRLCADHLRNVGAGVTLHKLRHRFATRLYELSNDPMLVKDLLGHSSLASTQIYLGVSAARSRGYADELASTLAAGRVPA